MGECGGGQVGPKMRLRPEEVATEGSVGLTGTGALKDLWVLEGGPFPSVVTIVSNLCGPEEADVQSN